MIEKLKNSAKKSENCACMGIDPIFTDLRRIGDFFDGLFASMKKNGLIPSAFKPNLGFFSCMDRPLDGDFGGSRALASVLKLIGDSFPGIPVILDSKRGDIARSSLNYAKEAFEAWNADMVTISPYMGEDSVMPFAFAGKGAYILVRTSNPGGRDLQNLLMKDSSDMLFESVASNVIGYNDKAKNNHSVFGAVLGATNLGELKAAASLFSSHDVPLLIPGVGSQGGSATDVMKCLKEAGYPAPLARINSSSKLTHPWKSEDVPADGISQCLRNIESLLEECRC